jgi:prepilin-type processing-associated H-X9-DG protein
LALIAYGDSYDGFLPVRSSASGLANDFPHLVDRNTSWSSSTPVASRLAATLVDLVGGKAKTFYCPANFEKRTEAVWWPRGADFGATYQFPFLLPASRWAMPAPDYGPNRGSTALLAADYFATFDFGRTNAKVWNHGVGSQPSGMNRLYADGHVTWANANGGTWMSYAHINTSVNLWWHWLE